MSNHVNNCTTRITDPREQGETCRRMNAALVERKAPLANSKSQILEGPHRCTIHWRKRRRYSVVRTLLGTISLVSIFPNISSGQELNTLFDPTFLNWSDGPVEVIRIGPNRFQLNSNSTGPEYHMLGQDFVPGGTSISIVDSMGQLLNMTSNIQTPGTGFPSRGSYLVCEDGGSLRAINAWTYDPIYSTLGIHRMDQLGTTHWTYWLGSANISDMHELSSGDFLLLSNSGEQGGTSRLIRLDQYGDTVRTTTMNMKVDAIDLLINGAVLLSGTQENAVNYVLVDSLGELGLQTSIAQDSNASMIGHGAPQAGIRSTVFTTELSDGRKLLHEMRLLADGTPSIQLTHDTLPSNSWRLSARKVSNDDLLVTGWLLVQDSISGFVQRTSGNGVRLWRRTYKPSYPDQTVLNGSFHDAIEISQNSFLVLGTRHHDTSTHSRSDLWLVKLDGDGCIVPGCNSVGIAEQATNLLDAISLYPNPAREQVTIQLDLPASIGGTALQLSVVGSDGRLVVQEQVASGTRALSLSVATLSSGLYHVHITNGTTWLTGAKLVVE